MTRFSTGKLCTSCVLAGGVVGVVGGGLVFFYRVLGAFWGPFGDVLATWWASFWNLDGLRCLLGAQGILESEFGHILHHFGGHFGRLFRRFWHHFLIHFWRSHFISLSITF